MVRKQASASLIQFGKVKRAEAKKGQRAQPELKEARAQFKVVQREVSQLERSVKKAAVALAKAEGNKAASKVAQAILTAQTKLLKAAKRNELKCSGSLSRLIAVDARRLQIESQAKALAVYKKKLAVEAESELAKFMSRLEAAWKKSHYQADAKRMATKLKKDTVKAVASRKKSINKTRLAAQAALLLAGSEVRKMKARAEKKLSKVSRAIRA